jgi:hypothetical protein
MSRNTVRRFTRSADNGEPCTSASCGASAQRSARRARWQAWPSPWLPPGLGQLAERAGRRSQVLAVVGNRSTASPRSCHRYQRSATWTISCRGWRCVVDPGPVPADHPAPGHSASRRRRSPPTGPAGCRRVRVFHADQHLLRARCIQQPQPITAVDPAGHRSLTPGTQLMNCKSWPGRGGPACRHCKDLLGQHASQVRKQHIRSIKITRPESSQKPQRGIIRHVALRHHRNCARSGIRADDSFRVVCKV